MRNGFFCVLYYISFVYQFTEVFSGTCDNWKGRTLGIGRMSRENISTRKKAR